MGAGAGALVTYLCLTTNNKRIISESNREQAEYQQEISTYKELLRARDQSHTDELTNRRKLHEKEVSDLWERDRDQNAKLRRDIEAAEEKGFQKAMQIENEKLKAFSVDIRPYIKQTDKKYSVWKNFDLEIGFQYQLLVNGIPCFEPHKVIEQRRTEKQVDPDAITDLAVQVAKAAIQLYAGPAASMIPFNANPIREKG